MGERTQQSFIEQFLSLCKIYGVKNAVKTFFENDLTEFEYELNREGREKLKGYRELLIASGMYSPEPCERNVIRFPGHTAPMYSLGVSARTGQFLDSDDYEMVEVPDEVPLSANFALHVCGDSMEPTLYDGEIIWVHMKPTLETARLGFFSLTAMLM